MGEILDHLMNHSNFKMTKEDALELIQDAKDELQDRLSGDSPEDPFEICADYFALEPDYLHELLDFEGKVT
jgi:hypothetical protein